MREPSLGLASEKKNVDILLSKNKMHVLSGGHMIYKKISWRHYTDTAAPLPELCYICLLQTKFDQMVQVSRWKIKRFMNIEIFFLTSKVSI